jgi:hypothetical protein
VTLQEIGCGKPLEKNRVEAAVEKAVVEIRVEPPTRG